MKKLKSWFIVEEDGATKGPAKKAPAAKKTAASPTPKTTPKATAPAAPVTSREGKVSDRFSKVLLKAMEEADQPGFDYLEFKKALENLKKVSMDEGTRYQSAYAMAQAMNVSPQSLINSASHYLNALEVEEQKFNTALNGQIKSQVADQQAQLPKLEQRVKELELKIQELQKEIAATKKQQEKTRQTVNNATAKLQNTKQDFEVTYQMIRGQIQRDIDNMKNYLAK